MLSRLDAWSSNSSSPSGITQDRISGGAESSFHDAISAGLDAFVTGEASEWVMNVARESATHFIAAGHYATERLGVQALGDHLRQKFGIEVHFEDIPNPV